MGVDSEQWSCKFCLENQIEAARNCCGKYEPIAIQVFDEVLTQCPVSLLDADACETIAVLEATEASGFGGGGMLPSDFLDQTNYAHNIRKIVGQEKARLEKKKKDK